MQLKHRALATAAMALSLTQPALAQSGVTLYGQVDAFVGSTRASGGERTAILGAGGMQTSYWGMRGTEDLGDGLKAIFDLNGFYRVDTGRFGRADTDGFLTRSAYVGLQSSRYGTVRLGRNTTPYFLSTILFNPLVDSYNFGPSIFHTYKTATDGRVFDPGIIGDSGWSNSVVYSSPTAGGLTVNLIYAFGEQPGSTGQNKWGGNLNYFAGAFAATAAFQQVKFNTVPGDVTAPAALVGFDKQTAAQLGVSYDFGVAKLFGQAQYIRTAIHGAQDDIQHANGQVGVSVPVGAGSLLTSYAYGNTRNDVAGMGRHTAAIAYDYNLSKRTDLYAAYFYDRVTGRPHAETIGAGMRHRF
ncbi:Porin [Cupriavidus taiwanensis]|uniref:Porin n=1 Tax=Cupriavidus taiwanensis TaxID=164546 RepID=A0A375I778_9BURK|nr:porin [Cupriavidus taiwanensis]SOY42703.1 Porin [Cupriavidus taiwanensis]SOY45317.1 Porin [Cupriavidus taiwanensis]SOY80710.1 Porin [Cupriavidus taiwanensis]SOZ52512.1 Porin [Cupriavidus taiwanensis]SOZ77069.1 Porin [Cupriavidus taiwanensis]